MEWKNLFTGNDIVFGLFALEFMLLLYFSFVALLNTVRVEMDIRKRYSDRATFLADFFRIYLERKNQIEEELREEEEARHQARLAAESD